MQHKTKLTKSELALLRQSLPREAIGQIAADLGVSYAAVWQLLNHGRKSGWYDAKQIETIKNYSR